MSAHKNIGLVFSGGGARGAYQVGAWRAMQELGIDVSVAAVYGTSVGAINGAAFVQGDIDLTEDIWLQLTYDKVFADIPPTRPSLDASKQYIEWITGSIKNRGLNVSPLKEILRKSLEEKVIRSSDIDYGCVVYDVAKRKTLYLKKEELPQDRLVEYVIASSTFPIFQPHRIDERLYIDGGVTDNRPMRFFDQHVDVDVVICIDVTAARHFWPKKATDGDHEVFFVRPSKLLGSPMRFTKDGINANFKLGYEDARRQLGAYFAVRDQVV